MVRLLSNKLPDDLQFQGPSMNQCFSGMASSTAPASIAEKNAALEQKRAMLLEPLPTLHYTELFFLLLSAG